MSPLAAAPTVTIIAESVNPLGENLLVLLVLAMGAALAFGNIMALVRPREDVPDGELDRPPLVRSLIQIGIGLVAAIWALVSLVA